MNFFLFSGVPGCGKTTSVWNIYQYLISNNYYVIFPHTVPVHNPPASPPDISCILSNGIKTVIIHSASDEPKVIESLISLCNSQYNVDVVISTVRSPISSIAPAYIPDPRGYFLKHLQPYAAGNFCIELPLNKNYVGRSFHKTILLWYHSTTASTAQHILINQPFNLL